MECTQVQELMLANTLGIMTKPTLAVITTRHTLSNMLATVLLTDSILPNIQAVMWANILKHILEIEHTKARLLARQNFTQRPSYKERMLGPSKQVTLVYTLRALLVNTLESITLLTLASMINSMQPPM